MVAVLVTQRLRGAVGMRVESKNHTTPILPSVADTTSCLLAYFLYGIWLRVQANICGRVVSE